MIDNVKWEENGVKVKYSKIFTFNDNLDSMSEIYCDSRSNKMKYVILDLSDVNKISLNDDDYRVLAGYDFIASKRIDNLKLAILIDDPHLEEDNNKFFRYFQKYDTSWECKIFFNMDELNNWIPT